ncbi:SLBB domain-containing protein [Spirosoma sp. BT704]|uniref:SLBB domain-containing protein n=2 Tax=Spirosoma validum TaxID=2771355 RepID=A0A927B7J8_9BACT|nr:SLBB domain-containing protein [Spirosoma validum]
MQNPPNIHILMLNFFLFIRPFFKRQFIIRIAVLVLSAVGLTAQAQIIAPSSGATTAPSSGAVTTPGAIRSGATTPSAVQSGRGVTLPAGVNPSNLPANAQQQLNQLNNQRNGQTQGQPNGQTGRSNASNADPTAADPNNPNQANDPNNPTDPNQQTSNTNVKSEEDRAREEARQKVFGYSLFNDPAMKTTFQPNTNMATPRNYVIGPGDELRIRLYGYSEVDYTQKVSPEGAVYVAQGSGIGPIQVAGLTIEQAKARLASRLSTKFAGLRNSSYGPQNTFLELSLGEIRSIRVTVTGDAVRPGTYTLSSLSTAMNAIYQAGGPNDIGSYRKVQLIRNNRVVAALDLYDYLLNGIQRNDLRLQDNDNIRFTTFSERVEINGTVKRNNIFEMLPSETLDRLLFYAGDFTANAYRNRLKVRRVTDRELKVIDVTTPEFKTFALRDGDVVTAEQVLDRFENKITIEGAIYRPGEYSLDNNPTLKKLIANAEGLKGDAFTGRINIIRTREDLAMEQLSVNLDAILAGTQPDLPLQREDQVIITSRFELAEPASISVQGEVNKPLEDIAYMANMTLNDALLKTGGLRESAAASKVEVVRRKRDADPSSKTAQIAEVFTFNVNRDLSLNADDNKFVLAPFDQIVVRRSPNYQIQTFAGVEGEVITPGLYPIKTKDQKISDLLNQAGGLSPFAYVEGATLLRAITLSEDEIVRKQAIVDEVGDNDTKVVVERSEISPNKLEPIDINLKKILANPGSSEDILVQEHDILRIPKLLETVRVQGEVQLPKTVKYRTGQTFQDYIGDAGGFTTRSQRRRSFVVYANGSVDRTRKFMFFNIYPRVEPGSEVIVPRRSTTPLTPQQLLSSTAGTISSLLSVIGLIIALSRVGR